MAENIEILDKIEKFKSIDVSGMLTLVEKLPEMMDEGWSHASDFQVDGNGIQNIVISGMGGSAISGDIVASVLKEMSALPVIVNRGYQCPGFVNKSTLFIAVSYSGNTEETLSSIKGAIEKKARIVAVCSGGELMNICQKNGIPVIEVPGKLPPRAALGYLLSPILHVLHKIGAAHNIKADFDSSVKQLKGMTKKLGAANPSRENDVKQMAIKLAGKIPVICASIDTTIAAGLRWKTQLNENSKMTALFAVFPELNHNDMVNFAHLKPGEHIYSFVLLRDEHDMERMKKRIEITKSLISGNVGGMTEIWSQGKSLLERIMYLIQYGDYLSVYLAALNGVDPTPVDIIDKLKKELNR